MTNPQPELYVGDSRFQLPGQTVQGTYVHQFGERYYRIAHYDQMPPFFMSLVSSADHWLFIASTGGLTAGRTNPDSALFPYETEDKITAHGDETGSVTILRVTRAGRTHLWEPFSARYAGLYQTEFHLYKNVYGNKVLFEAVNQDLQLTLRYGWRTSDRFGFIRSCWLQNDGADDCSVALLDGLQNLLPTGATAALQTSFSSLLHAYKRSELEPGTGLGIFALSATLTDQAEPSESLRATVAWQTGLTPLAHLLCTDQMGDFRQGQPLVQEQDQRGKAGAYLVGAEFALAPGQSQRWHLVADVNQDGAAVVDLIQLLDQDAPALEELLEADIDQGATALVNYVAGADGLQSSAQLGTTAHHFSNVLFNIMRGGIFAQGYQIPKADLLDFIRVRNRPVLTAYGDWFGALPPEIPVDELYTRAAASGAADLIRLCYEYLPLTFSRRHGDPSRPWNQFSINLKREDGSRKLDYQGNWRDIFQNWEPLALSYPLYVTGMIAKFLNATTADGYNPYRITRAGIEWEVPEPDNPWANIGYWSDHQIIYLQKLLEIGAQVDPASLSRLWDSPTFTYAAVPYRLRPYGEMLADWYHTIAFDWEAEQAVQTGVAELGTDGRLHRDVTGQVIHVTMGEKLLSLLLAKVTNLVPEGGIWMNTQRPEWNDANNALVGKGLSVVTAAYLRRFVAFWQGQLAQKAWGDVVVNQNLAALLAQVQEILGSHQSHLTGGFDDRSRRTIMDALGAAATGYRAILYADGLSQTQVSLSAQSLSNFLALTQSYLEQTLRANRRADDLYHAYNVMGLVENGTRVETLYAMLEGQVAILSAGLLTPEEALSLLHSLRHSDLYRADQHTYMLYPNRELPGFLDKNRVSPDQVAESALIAALTAAGDPRLLVRDHGGVYHFHGGFRNAQDVARVLDGLAQEEAYADLASAERDFVLALFETTFQHRKFTGRSGTFFAYEGLGSVYWHMVAKLLLAVQECYQAALHDGADTVTLAGLAEAYYDIRQGLGFNKSPEQYGAFPADPYSHTPAGGGARQPGMTGQVKEEILTRWGELGVSIRQGKLTFAPTLLRRAEFSTEPGEFTFLTVAGEEKQMPLPVNSLAFTFCQTPVLYTLGDGASLHITYGDGRTEILAGAALDATTSQQIFSRSGDIERVQVTVQV